MNWKWSSEFILQTIYIQTICFHKLTSSMECKNGLDLWPGAQSVISFMGQEWGESIVVMLEYIILYAFMLVRYGEPGLDRHDAEIKEGCLECRRRPKLSIMIW